MEVLKFLIGGTLTFNSKERAAISLLCQVRELYSILDKSRELYPCTPNAFPKPAWIDLLKTQIQSHPSPSYSTPKAPIVCQTKPMPLNLHTSSHINGPSLLFQPCLLMAPKATQHPQQIAHHSKSQCTLWRHTLAHTVSSAQNVFSSLLLDKFLLSFRTPYKCHLLCNAYPKPPGRFHPTSSGPYALCSYSTVALIMLYPHVPISSVKS